MAEPFISQVPGILFTVSSEAFDTVTEECDKALASAKQMKARIGVFFSLYLHN